jgi:hypothetical protein
VTESIRRTVASWPPLSEDQRTKLTTLLAPVSCDQGAKFEGIRDKAGEPATA